MNEQADYVLKDKESGQYLVIEWFCTGQELWWLAPSASLASRFTGAAAWQRVDEGGIRVRPMPDWWSGGVTAWTEHEADDYYDLELEAVHVPAFTPHQMELIL